MRNSRGEEFIILRFHILLSPFASNLLEGYSILDNKSDSRLAIQHIISTNISIEINNNNSGGLVTNILNNKSRISYKVNETNNQIFWKTFPRVNNNYTF